MAKKKQYDIECLTYFTCFFGKIKYYFPNNLGETIITHFMKKINVKKCQKFVANLLKGL